MKKNIPQNISYFKEIELVLQGIQITSNTSFSINDQIVNVLNQNKRRNKVEDDEINRETLCRSLAQHLYQIVHCRQASIGQDMSPYNSISKGINDHRIFVDILSQSNNGTGTWEPGWIICKLENNGMIAVKKNGLTLWVRSYQLKVRDSNQPRIGDRVYIAMVKEFRELLPGFYMANGNAAMKEESFIVRLYWNISSEGAPAIMNSLTTELNKDDIPFKFKILKNESNYLRADAAVLYLDKHDIQKVSYSLSQIYKKIKRYIRPPVPLFAKRLANGISLAEDPANGESFGQNRTNLLAKAIYLLRNVSIIEEKLKNVQEYFEINTIDFNRPYLRNLNSKDEYDEMLNGTFR
jgi:hypothetical protein